MEDWQWLCLVQVVVSTILYIWKEPHSLVGHSLIPPHDRNINFGSGFKINYLYSI